MCFFLFSNNRLSNCVVWLAECTQVIHTGNNMSAIWIITCYTKFSHGTQWLLCECWPLSFVFYDDCHSSISLRIWSVPAAFVFPYFYKPGRFLLVYRVPQRIFLNIFRSLTLGRPEINGLWVEMGGGFESAGIVQVHEKFAQREPLLVEI